MKKHHLLIAVVLLFLCGIYALAQENCDASSGQNVSSSRSASGKTTPARSAAGETTVSPSRPAAPELTLPAETTAAQKTTRAAESKTQKSTTKAKTTAAPTTPAQEEPQRKHGTADTLSGRTVVISIFTSDSTSSWDFDKQKDVNTYWDCLDCLATAAKYLEKQAKKYDTKAKFIYDWKENDDLGWMVSFPDDQLVREDGSMYNTQARWALDHFDPDEYMKKYKADNVIYIFFFNTKKSNTVNPWAINGSQSRAYDADIVNLYVRFDDVVTPPCSYAHEILHTFGAYDLYYSGSGIPEAYVKHLKETDSKDIMYTVNMGDEITSKFTELDAYYVGLTDHSKEAERWGLPISEHAAD